MGVYQRGLVWYLRWRDEHGRKRRKATTAATRREALRLLAEVEANVQRVELRLDPLPAQVRTSETLWELCAWWLKRHCSERSLPTETLRLRRHVERTQLGAVPVASATADLFASYFEEMEDEGRAPATINRLRTTLQSIFTAAAAPPCRWAGTNPLNAVPVRAVPKKKYETLRAEELDGFLAKVPGQWRGFFATGVLLAFRKGEACGLLKSAVDLRHLVVLVASSYEHQTTKGGDKDSLPIPPALVPYFRAALMTPGPWMFPNLRADPTGMTMLSPHANPEKICRTAQKAAGIVTGYTHTCRRCGHDRRPRMGGEPVPSPFRPHSEEHPDDAPRRCPQCGMKLWAEGHPRFRRFHDLRHSTATILLRAGVDIHRVQKIMRHADIKVTEGTYGHLQVEDLRASLSLVSAPSAPSDESEAQTEHTATTRRNRAGGKP